VTPLTIPKPLQRVLSRAIVTVNRHMTELEQGLDPDTWYDKFAQAIETYHREALQTGLGTLSLTERNMQYLDAVVEAQLGFLDGWKLEIQAEPQFRQEWKARAALYALSVKQDYWAGVSRFLPLPAMPGDGTSQCLGNCNCQWDIYWIDEEKGDADATWLINPGEHCQTCLQRAADWAPLRIRSGILVGA